MYYQRLYHLLVDLILLPICLSQTYNGQQDTLYGSPCSVGGVRTQICQGGTNCNVHLTTYGRPSAEFDLQFCSNPNEADDLLDRIIREEGFCKIQNVTSVNNDVQYIPENSCLYGHVCEKYSFYFQINNVWFRPYTCVQSNERLCATRNIHSQYYIGGVCPDAVTISKPCNAREVCIHQYQQGFSLQGTNELQFNCYPLCKTTMKNRYMRDESKYHSRCPRGLVCAERIRDISQWPNCTEVKGYQCTPWPTYIQKLAAQGYFFSLYGTHEKPCSVQVIGSNQFEDIFTCPPRYPCILRVPQSATTSPAALTYDSVDEQTYYRTFYCGYIVPELQEATRHRLYNLYNRPGTNDPILCKAQLQDPSNMPIIDIESCPRGKQCLPYTHAEVTIQHKILQRVFTSSSHFFTAWICYPF